MTDILSISQIKTMQEGSQVKPNSNITDKPLTIQSAAEYLSVSRGQMYHLVKTGAIAHFRPRRKIYFRREDLDSYLNGSTQRKSYRVVHGDD